MLHHPFRRTFRDARLAIHAALTAVMAWLAFVLALPIDTFGTGQSFRLMASMGTEEHWAMAFWLVASLGLVGLLAPGRWVRLGSALVLATTHGAVAGLFALANPATTASGTYGALAVLGYYLAWRRADEGV